MNPTLQDLQNEATWLEYRSLAIPALKSTELVTTEDTRAEFLEGARLLRLDARRRYDGSIGPTPIQLVIADTLNAGHTLNGILEPRRTTKTTSIQAVVLGRCTFRDDYQVGWTLATTGAKAGERFRKDIVTHLERVYPDKDSRPFIINSGKGSEHIRWPGNGSYLNVYAPGGDGFRSGGFDVAWVDEGGEAEPELGEDLIAAILPTFHTRNGAQFIVSGTAGAYREGQLLWDILNDPRAGVLWHGIPDDIDPEALEAWEASEEFPRARVRELVEVSHPGIGWSTPLEAVESDFHTPAMRKNFNAEILSQFGAEGGSTAHISQPRWVASGRDLDDSELPATFALVAFVDPNALYASVAASWKDTEGKTHVVLLHHQTGVEGFGKKLLLLARKHKRAIIFDGASNATEVEMRQLREAKPAPQEKPQTSRTIGRAAVHFMNQLNQGKLVHYNQDELNAATEVAVKHTWDSGNGWTFRKPKVKGKVQEEVDITPLEAVALAAYMVAEEKPSSNSVDFGWAA